MNNSKWILTGLALAVLMAGCRESQKAMQPVAKEQAPAPVAMAQAVTLPEKFNWQSTGKDELNLYFVDEKNISAVDNGSTRYWTGVIHNTPMTLGPYKGIKIEMQLIETDCKSGNSTFVYWVAQDRGGKEIASRTMNTPDEIEAGSFSAKARERACRR